VLDTLAHGLRRLAVLSLLAGGGLALLGTAIALLRGHPVAHAVSVTFYVGAAVVALGAIGGGGGARGGRYTSSRALLENQRRKDAQLGDNVWFLLLALLLVTAGYAVASA
jgi:hypothetical protein